MRDVDAPNDTKARSRGQVHTQDNRTGHRVMRILEAEAERQDSRAGPGWRAVRDRARAQVGSGWALGSLV